MKDIVADGWNSLSNRVWLGAFPLIPISMPAPERRILIVDREQDATVLSGLIRTFLLSELFIVPSMKEALAAARRNFFDLVFTDYQLPDGNGLLLLSKLRQQGQAMPAVLMTHEAKIACFLQPSFLQITTVLTKPLGLRNLKIAVEEGLAQRNLQNHQVRRK